MGEKKFSSFKMSETTRDQILVLPQDMQLKFFWAVMNFGLDGIEPDFNGIELAIWIPMRDLIVNSKQQDEAWCNKQRENGKKGGRPRKTLANKETQDNPKNPGVIEETQKTQGFSEETQKTLNININNKNKDKDKEKPVFVFPDQNPFEDKPPEFPPDGGSATGPPEPSPSDEKPAETKEDAITIWNKAREFWNEKGLKPVCRDIMIRAGDTSDILRTFQVYSWNEIRNAIGNYAWHKFQAGQDFRPPPPYGSFAGFLKNGVEKYHDDNSLDQQFKESRK